MRKMLLASAAILSAGLAVVNPLPVNAQSVDAVEAEGTVDQLDLLRTAVLSNDQELIDTLVTEMSASDNGAVLFELGRYLSNHPSPHILWQSDAEQAIAVLRRAVEVLDGEPGRDARRLLNRSRYELALLLIETRESAEDLATARTMLEQAASSGYGPAALQLGRALAEGVVGAPADMAASEPWLRRALNAGEGRAALLLSRQLIVRGSEEDLAEAEGMARLGIAMLRQNALQGDTGEAVDLAQAYLSHPAIEQDVAQALNWLDYAVARGDANAMVGRAEMYLDPTYGAPDPTRARDLLIQAASEGSANAAIILARTLLVDEASAMDVPSTVAQQWLDRAMAVNEARAFRLAARLAGSSGDVVAEQRLLQRAAFLGDVSASIDLIEVLVATGRIDRAVTVVESLENGRPLTTSATIGLAMIKLEADPGSPLYDPENGLRLLRDAGAQGDGRALYYLGVAHGDDGYAEPDPEQSFAYYRQSAERGYFRGIVEVARHYAQGIGVDKSDEHAAEWLTEARRVAENGSSDHMLDLGRAIVRGEMGDAGTTEEGLEWLERAVDLGNTDAMVELAGTYWDGSAGQFDPYQAVELYKAALAAGNVEAQYYLGRAFATGIGAEINQRLAMEYFTASAEAGNVAAATELGLMYTAGGVVPTDFERAYDWLLMAAEAGHVPAMIYMSNLIAFGELEGADNVAALSWLERAANSGDSEAQFQLAVALERGLLSEPDLERAIYWMRQASENGFFQAGSELGRMLQSQESQS